MQMVSPGFAGFRGRRWRVGRLDPPAIAREASAQGTVEYAITLFAVIALIAGIAALWRAGQQGVFVKLVESAASHVLDGTGALDIALY